MLPPRRLFIIQAVLFTRDGFYGKANKLYITSKNRISVLGSAFSRGSRPFVSLTSVRPNISSSTGGSESTISDDGGLSERLSGCIWGLRGGSISSKPGDGEERDADPKPSELLRSKPFFLSGSLLPSLRHLFAGSRESYKMAWQVLKDTTDFGDIITIACLVIFSSPVMRLFFSFYQPLAAKFGRQKGKYEDSKISTFGKNAEQVSLIAMSVYVVELATTFVTEVISEPGNKAGDLFPLENVPKLFTSIVYGFWVSKKALVTKRKILEPLYESCPSSQLYDRASDFFISTVIALFALSFSGFKLGLVFNALLAVDAIFSVVVALALKEPLTQIIQGFSLLTRKKISVGENVTLGDGTSGKVSIIGWFETTLLAGDGISVRIPNADIAKQKIYNKSRIARSQVNLDLRFHIHDMDRIDDLTKTIREEINDSCPLLVRDGSSTFRVVWTDIKEDHLLVSVTSHYDILPGCAEYWNNREIMLKAIARAAKKCCVDFAIPVKMSLRGK
mmetsp:Transcript_17464/g.34763  ORF Transcript_17464/g.34763 Transcript_17464/m.34763 type:complete len:504 (+) Transcript_17464:76-1587(+)